MSKKKATKKPAAKKTVVKKAVVKKAAPKKIPARKVAAKKPAQQKVPAKKAPAKKSVKKAGKKTAAKPLPQRAGGFLDFFKKKKPAPAPAPKPAPAVKKPSTPPAAPPSTTGLPPVPAGMVRIDVRDNHYYDSNTHHMANRRVPIYKLDDRSGYFFRASMNVDADGAPKCYHPTNDKIALDDLANSTSHSRKYIQGQNGVGPAAGYYVSQTSLLFSGSQSHRCDNFVDAVEIPYMVFPNGFHDTAIGDCAVIYNTQNDQITHAIFADTNSRVGEASVKTAHNLGRATASPRNGIDEAIFIYLIFPASKLTAAASAPHWPDAAIKQAAMAKFAEWGGIDKLREVAGKI
jgi:hypothetical protein